MTISELSRMPADQRGDRDQNPTPPSEPNEDPVLERMAKSLSNIEDRLAVIVAASNPLLLPTRQTPSSTFRRRSASPSSIRASWARRR